MNKIIKWGLIGFFALVVISAIAGGGGDKKTTTQQSNSGLEQTKEVKEEIEKRLEKIEEVGSDIETEKQEVVVEDDKYPNFKDGTYIVGKDIEPGTYRAKSPSEACYYARLSGLSGAMDEILANDNTSNPVVIAIAETDKGFQSKGCGTWTQDLSAITTDKTTFNDGIFILGTDIEPGTYKNKGQTGCYYARLSNFTGGMGSILANENTDDPAIITILATDKGFQSNRCGTWEKVE